MPIIPHDPTDRQRIDLSGPDGNAFALLKLTGRYGKTLLWQDDKIKAVKSEMMAGDYEHLIKTFDENFGEYVDLVRPAAITDRPPGVRKSRSPKN